MQKFLLINLFFIFGSTLFAQQPSNKYCSKYKLASIENRLLIEDKRSDSLDILHTQINLDMTNITAAQISGNAVLTCKSKHSVLNSMTFDFEGLTVDSVNGADVSSFVHQDSILRVFFSGPLNLGQESELTIYYHGSPMKDASGWGGFYFSGNFSWNLGVGFADDPHSYGRIWFPCFDNFIERSTFSFYVKVQPDRVASCNGVLASVETNTDSTKTFHFELDQSIPSYLACVAVAPYITVESSVNAANGPLPIVIYGRSADSMNIVQSFTHLDEAILKFEEAFGPYRFDKVGYSLVPFSSGAMEHATNITYPIYASNGNLSQEGLMAHELGHMWWGDNVTCQTDGDMWINEGWASFSEYLFQEAVYGRSSYEEALLEDLRYMLQFGHHYEEDYRAVAGQPHQYVYGDHVYKKGALVAHNLRGYLGDELFFSAAHQFMEQFKYSPVSSDSLEKYFSIYSGKDLSFFFRDWVFTPGYNLVVLDSFEAVNSNGGYDLTLFVQQKLKGTATFHEGVPVYYSIYDENWDSESGVAFIDGRFAEIKAIASIDPKYVILYDHVEQAQARTVDRVVVKNQGPLNLDNMYWDVDVDDVVDSALVYFEHFWSSPDDIKAFDTKAYRLSNYHYWRVSGLNLDQINMSGQFFYDGRPGGSGYLDMDLVSIQEDSLVLLYRSGTTNDWVEYGPYLKNILGTSDNGFGLIVLDSIFPGEYTLANVDQTALSSYSEENSRGLKVFPNPTNNEITFQLLDLNSSIPVSGMIYDQLGRLVDEIQFDGNQSKLNTTSYKSGLYTYKVGIDGLEASGKFIVEH